jgi:hypothetical protein
MIRIKLEGGNPMMSNRNLCLTVGALLLALTLVACEKKEEGPGERAGKQVDKAVEQAGQAMDKAAESVKQAAKEAAEKTETVAKDAADRARAVSKEREK